MSYTWWGCTIDHALEQIQNIKQATTVNIFVGGIIVRVVDTICRIDTICRNDTIWSLHIVRTLCRIAPLCRSDTICPTDTIYWPYISQTFCRGCTICRTDTICRIDTIYWPYLIQTLCRGCTICRTDTICRIDTICWLYTVRTFRSLVSVLNKSVRVKPSVVLAPSVVLTTSAVHCRRLLFNNIFFRCDSYFGRRPVSVQQLEAGSTRSSNAVVG